MPFLVDLIGPERAKHEPVPANQHKSVLVGHIRHRYPP